MERKELIDDAVKALISLSRDTKTWETYEKRDDIMRELKFVASSLKNANVNYLMLQKAMDALMINEARLAYSILYSNNKVGTQSEEILDKKFRNNETNFTGKLVLLSNSMK